ncbi:hypothetical protein T492DRAFT_1116487 [Pavlovales sp. CCMP2436]|nr:hypothetical protein T492DRAFT_1116487 [Pavlovales sp. CCMP2436]
MSSIRGRSNPPNPANTARHQPAARQSTPACAPTLAMSSRRGAACLLLATQLSSVGAFAVMTKDARLGLDAAWRWPSPVGALSAVGLGGGLFYAVEETFCDSLLPTFSDDLLPDTRVLVTCAHLKGAIASAFATWGQNHKNIHFVDAGSERCVPSAAEGVVSNESVHDVAAARGCIEPDIVLRAPQLEAKVYDVNGTGTRAATTRLRVSGENGGVRLTDGKQSEQGRRIVDAQIDFNINMCWYIDGGFCMGLHQWAKARAMFGVAWALALSCGLLRAMYVLWLARSPIFATYSSLLAGQAARCRCTHLTTLQTSTPKLPWASFVFTLFALVYPPLLWTRVFLPCFECTSFQAALTHEIGHSLGLSHPDERAVEGLNQRAVDVKSMRTGSCASSAVRYDFTDEPPAGSIMNKLAQHGDGCLWQDNLDGLNALYPLCSQIVRQGPRCLKFESNTGWLRVLIVSLVPLAVVLLLSFALSLVIARRRRAQSLESQRPSVESISCEKLRARKGSVSSVLSAATSASSASSSLSNSRRNSCAPSLRVSPIASRTPSAPATPRSEAPPSPPFFEGASRLSPRRASPTNAFRVPSCVLPAAGGGQQGHLPSPTPPSAELAEVRSFATRVRGALQPIRGALPRSAALAATQRTMGTTAVAGASACTSGAADAHQTEPGIEDTGPAQAFVEKRRLAWPSRAWV